MDLGLLLANNKYEALSTRYAKPKSSTIAAVSRVRNYY